MRDRFYNSLPNLVKKEFDEIETFINTKLVVRVANINDGMPPDATMGALYGGPNLNGVGILIKDISQITTDGAMHELLHLRKYLIEGSPDVMGSPYLSGQLAIALSNTIDHFDIIPRQRKLGALDVDRWDRQQALNLDIYTSKTFTGWNERQFLTILALSNITTENSEIINSVNSLVKQHENGKEIEGFVDDAQDVLSNKREMLVRLLDFFGIHKRHVCLRYANVKNRSTRDDYLAAW